MLHNHALSGAIAHTTPHDHFAIQRHVNRGFEDVRETFAENFARRRELGGACCAFVGGEKVIDLWGGFRNKRTEVPRCCIWPLRKHSLSGNLNRLT